MASQDRDTIPSTKRTLADQIEAPHTPPTPDVTPASSLIAISATRQAHILASDHMESWLKRSGATGLDDDNLELADFPDTGRGVKTQRRYGKGEVILTIPGQALWTVGHAHADPLFGPAVRSVQPSLSTDDVLATYILFVRSRRSGHDGLQSHVAVLPKSYTSSIFFSVAELEVCAGTSLYTTTKHLIQQIEVGYKALLTNLFVQFQDLFPLHEFTIDDYKWALCTVWSRAMDFKLQDGTSVRLLAPFADMLNHSQEVEQCHIYDPSSGKLSVLAGKDYEPGDQVFINYGPVSNSRLLRLYGFVIPGNPNDSYDLVLTTHHAAPLYELKNKLWVSTGLDSTSTILLTRHVPLPNTVLQYLRIQRLSDSNFAAAIARGAGTEKVSNSNESEVLRFLVDSINGILDQFSNTAEALEKQLIRGDYMRSENARMAAHVSLGEQKVLRLAKERAEALLAQLEGGDVGDAASSTAQCANCKTVSADLMWCGRCNRVKYCGQDCQVAHFKEHKIICRKTAAANDSSRNC